MPECPAGEIEWSVVPVRQGVNLARLYRADEVPVILRPAFLLYGYGLGALSHAYLLLVRVFSTIEHEGSDQLSKDGNYIFAVWHQYTLPYLTVFQPRGEHVWLSHPYWYMKPAHVLMHLVGIRRLILGSTGNSGRRAADELLECLRAGASTGLTPDGPAGPARHARRGILHLAAQSGVAIIPLRIHCSRSFKLRGWDQKVIPLPFGKITVWQGRPLRVKADDLETAMSALEAQL